MCLASLQSSLISSNDADQLELSAIKDGTAPFERALWDEKVTDTLEDEQPPVGDELEGFAIREYQLDSGVTEVVNELKRRRDLLGKAYPFKIEKGFLRYTGSKTLVYEFCLAITQAPELSTKPYCDLPRAFERLTGHIVAAWLGPTASYYRAGWPPDGDRPSTFRRTIECLHDATNEWWWQARDERYADPKTVKDGGVDVVVWKHPPDGRVGGVFLLGQCGCGNGWDGKLKDLDPELIKKKYVRDISIAGEVRFLATPFHIAHPQAWDDASMAAGLIFDRVRLVAIAESRGNARRIARLARKPYESLIKLVIPDFTYAA
jgi:hypothetical protein